ncbi:MAG: PKD domain-containing protein [Candidatus Thermoplasmatota archaeon]|nr:PKD domain-containing protein [Candidatus Thermoplasmatota archaeon]
MRSMMAVKISVVAIILFFSFFSIYPSGAQDNPYTKGSGTHIDPYVIEDVWDLQNMTDDLSTHYVLGNDINASDTINWNSGAGFYSIGNANSPFTGSLDGRNHTITGLFIHRPGTDHVGLFGYTGSGATVERVILVDHFVKGSRYVGAIVGWNEGGVVSDCVASGTTMVDIHYLGGVVGINRGGIISNCSYKGIVDGKANGLQSIVGGIVGLNENGIISNCDMQGNITSRNYAGGIVGDNVNGMISNCYVMGSVRGSQVVGGIIGADGGTVEHCQSSADVRGSRNVGGLIGWKSGIVSNCYSTGNVNASDHGAGGLIGTLAQGIVSDCWSTGHVLSGRYYVGGLIGSNYGRISNCHSSGNVVGTKEVGGLVGRNEGRISNCYSTGNVTGRISIVGVAVSSLGGLIGYNGGKVSNSHYSIERVSINGGEHLTIGGLFEDQYLNWLSNDLTLDITDYGSSLALNEGYYHIDNIQGIRDMLGFVDDEEYNFRFSSDIDLSSAPGLYLPYFGASELDGNNHTITNLNLDLSFVSNVGMIGYNYAGKIKNIQMVNINVSGYENVGGLLGCNHNGVVSNCFASGTVNGVNDYTGGLVGLSSGTISGSSAFGIVKGTGSSKGGLVGSNNGRISDSNFIGNVTGNGASGGLVGSNSAIISNCYSKGDVKGGNNMGGLVGSNGGSVSNSHSESNVMGRSPVGGLMGYNSGNVIFCYASGEVTGKDCVGGLIGSNIGSVTKCYATGNVRGSWVVGGLIGSNGLCIVSNCYSTGKVIRISGNTTNFGGFVGLNEGQIINSYSTGRVIYNGSNDPTDKGFAGNIYEYEEYEMRGNFWDNETSLQTTTSGEAIGMNTTMMKTRKTFTDAGWDLRFVWCMIEKVTYPFLRWQDTKRPIADAGPDLIVDEGTFVEFDGSGSYDDRGIADYLWSFIDNKSVTLYGVKPAYQFNNPGIFIITLNVQDAVDTWGSDTMTVTVLDISPPSANAGLDLIVDEGTIVTFNGNGSYDNVGIVNYTWTFIDRDPIVRYGIDPGYRFDTPGVFIVTLNVSDAAGHWATDTMTVTVRDITAPIAVAGPDLTVDEGTVVYFDGSGSFDNVGIVNWTWTFVDGEIIMLTGMDPSYRFDTPGVYTVVLNVTDASGHWGVDSMIVTVLDITAPKAVAGLNRTVDEGTVVTFDGSGSYDNVGIANYTWTFIDGDPIVLYGIDPSYRFDTPGVYIVTLNVSDAAGLWAIDSLTVTIRDITPPVADAGEDQAIEEEDTVQFDGSGSNDNVGIVNYTWSFYDGSSSVMLYGISPSHTFSISGIYVVTLTVKDEAGNEGSDTMKVEAKEKEGNGIVDDPIDPLLIIGSIILLAGIIILVFFLFLRGRNRSPDEGSRWLEE